MRSGGDAIRAQRVQRVVGQQALPHQIPNRVDRLLRKAAAGRFVQRPEERRAVAMQVRDDRGFAPGQSLVALAVRAHAAAAACAR